MSSLALTGLFLTLITTMALVAAVSAGVVA